ncbi:hypothetical protein BX666DRAFT_1891073 [Dichotomocladium elegans]|nr:hypothetical protein BX666DRAFT_1891073 [Dichotomocladium elegans]
MIPSRFAIYTVLSLCLFAQAGWTAPIAFRTDNDNEPRKKKLLRQENFLNQILSTDSDEDVFFGRTWSDLFLDDEDDESAVMFVASSTDGDDSREAIDKQIIVITRTKQSFLSDPDEELDYFSDT